MSLREKLAALLTGNSPGEVQAELENLRIDNLVRKVTDDGFLPADEKTQEAARKLARFDSEAFDAIARVDRPVPAQETRVMTPSEPEDEIQKIASETGKPYHEVAAEYKAEGLINA